jgi:hypothetical protein
MRVRKRGGDGEAKVNGVIVEVGWLGYWRAVDVKSKFW